MASPQRVWRTCEPTAAYCHLIWAHQPPPWEQHQKEENGTTLTKSCGHCPSQPMGREHRTLRSQSFLLWISASFHPNLPCVQEAVCFQCHPAQPCCSEHIHLLLFCIWSLSVGLGVLNYTRLAGQEVPGIPLPPVP